jgi:CBS-domain-containing membrane protein
MTKDVIIVDVLASLEEARSLMEDNEVRRLPVVDEEGELVGILSWGDVREASSVEAAATNPYAPEADEEWLTVWESMTKDPIVVTPETSLADAVEMMLTYKIGCLPVVKSLAGPQRRQLVGIVTESDVFRLVLRDWRQQEQPH